MSWGQNVRGYFLDGDFDVTVNSRLKQGCYVVVRKAICDEIQRRMFVRSDTL